MNRLHAWSGKPATYFEADCHHMIWILCKTMLVNSSQNCQESAHGIVTHERPEKVATILQTEFFRVTCEYFVTEYYLPADGLALVV